MSPSVNILVIIHKKRSISLHKLNIFWAIFINAGVFNTLNEDINNLGKEISLAESKKDWTISDVKLHHPLKYVRFSGI